jgi:hypothetical protein
VIVIMILCYLAANVLLTYSYSVWTALDIAWPNQPPNRWTAPLWNVFGYYYRQDGAAPGWRAWTRRSFYAKQAFVLLFLAIPIRLVYYAHEGLKKCLR